MSLSQRPDESKERFNNTQIKEIESMVCNEIERFQRKYFNEFTLLKCLQSNPEVEDELKRININGRVDLPKRSITNRTISLYLSNIYRGLPCCPRLHSPSDTIQFNTRQYKKLKLNSKRTKSDFEEYLRNNENLKNKLKMNGIKNYTVEKSLTKHGYNPSSIPPKLKIPSVLLTPVDRSIFENGSIKSAGKISSHMHRYNESSEGLAIMKEDRIVKPFKLT